MTCALVAAACGGSSRAGDDDDDGAAATSGEAGNQSLPGAGKGGRGGGGRGGGPASGAAGGNGGESEGGAGSAAPSGPRCGNGKLEGAEACDDGNRDSDDGCSPTCERELGWVCNTTEPTACEELCADGLRVGAELRPGGCDDKNRQPDDGCDPDCRVEPGWSCPGTPSVCSEGCGDGEAVGGEECDDGNDAGDDGCFACAVERGWTCAGMPSQCSTSCGDGVTAGTEACDDGNTRTEECAYGKKSCTVCSKTCDKVAGATAYCGDGTVDVREGEECDDGDTDDGDGCDSACQVEASWNCTAASPSDCTTTCGDGVRAGSEECDDGNAVTEPCDYGETSCTVCSGDCHELAGSVSFCGDGLVDVGEECDDLNTESSDGCSAECTVEPGFSCDLASPTRCTPPSCVGLAHTCGPDGIEDCCTAPPLPGGTYNRSNDPTYPATLSPYRLDKYAVTVGRFRKFMSAYAGGWRPAVGDGKNPRNASDTGWKSDWDANLAPTTDDFIGCGGSWTNDAGANEHKPMVCVSWYEAFAFCAWDGGHLTTEAEYDFAAVGGTEQRYYAWSNPPEDTSIDATDLSYLCLGDGNGAVCDLADLTPVGTHPNGNGRWGHADLAGNSLTWTRDYAVTYPLPCTDCAASETGGWRLLRGGGWSYDASYMTAAFRFALYPTYVRTADLGVRCARVP